MKKFKVAICLGGQCRTWKAALPSFQSFFSPSPHVEFTIFGHTWDMNSWRIKSGSEVRDFMDEILPRQELESELRKAYMSKHITVTSQHQIKDHRFYHWSPMLKSAMYANNLKTTYELENNMRFDLVVKARWDALYHPSSQFSMFNQDIVPNALYANSDARLVREFRYPLIDDVLYYGSSRVMNIIDGFYHAYCNNSFYNLVGMNDNNPGFALTGVGVMLHKWATLNHILILSPGPSIHQPYIVRKYSEHLTYPQDYDEMFSNYLNFSNWYTEKREL